MRFRFITSTPLDISRGSGTFVGIRALQGAIEALNVAIVTVTPKLHLPVYTLERIVFNESLRLRRLPPADLTVGFDLDGYSVAGRGMPHIAALKGVIAEEARFEYGMTQATMLVQAAFERRHVHRAHLVVTTSRYSAGRAGEAYGLREAPEIVPELLDIAAWHALLSEHPASPDPRRFTVLSVARLYPRKRLPVLLGAAARLRDRIPGLEIRIVGDGPRRAQLRRICQDRRLESTVTLLGDVSREQLAAEYNRCHIFCLPSVQEAFGIVFLEAMAASKAVVAARAAAVPEVVRDGLLVEPDSEESLAAAIETLYRDPGLRDRLANAGARRVEEFDAPRVAARFIALARRVL